VAAAAVLPGRTGPLLSGCCTDSAGGPGGQAAAARAAWVPVPLAAWVPESRFSESEQRRPLALAAPRRSLRRPAAWLTEVCEPLSLESSRLAEIRARRAGPTVEGRFQSLTGIRISANPAARSFRG